MIADIIRRFYRRHKTETPPLRNGTMAQKYSVISWIKKNWRFVKFANSKTNQTNRKEAISVYSIRVNLQNIGLYRVNSEAMFWLVFDESLTIGR